RILINGTDQLITLPIKKDSDYLNVNQRYLPDDFDSEKKKLLNKIKGAYLKAPYFKQVFSLVENIINNSSSNLFDYIYNSIQILKEHLNITSELIKSSELNIDTAQYKGE